jgi:hypothetical protein
VNRDALTYALAAHGVDLPDAERDETLAVYHELEVFDDVRDAIGREARRAGLRPTARQFRPEAQSISARPIHMPV